MSTVSLRRSFVGPAGYVLLAVVLGVALFIGSGGQRISGDTARIAHLESIIRCPSCEDLSIAQSETTSAVGLRNEVMRLVHQGVPDSEIEARVEAQFPGTLLVPSGGTGLLVFLVPLGAIVVGIAVLTTFLLRRRSRTTRSSSKDDLALVQAALADRAGER